MPLLIVVVVLIVAGVAWRARSSRRLTVEESVDRYRRTLSAVHEAAARSHTGTGAESGPTRFERAGRSRRSWSPGPRRPLVVGAMAVATVVVIAVVINASHGTRAPRTAASTTTRPPPTRATAPPTTAAPTTTVPLVSASGTTFTVARPTYTLVVQTTTGACWIDARDASGASLFTGTLSNGQSQSINASTVKLQLGNPAAVTLSIDGTPVPFPLAGGHPVTLQFLGRAA